MCRCSIARELEEVDCAPAVVGVEVAGLRRTATAGSARTVAETRDVRVLEGVPSADEDEDEGMRGGGNGSLTRIRRRIEGQEDGEDRIRTRFSKRLYLHEFTSPRWEIQPTRILLDEDDIYRIRTTTSFASRSATGIFHLRCMTLVLENGLCTGANMEGEAVTVSLDIVMFEGGLDLALEMCRTYVQRMSEWWLKWVLIPNGFYTKVKFSGVSERKGKRTTR
ncbi:hypothetical protein BJ912DRAFT_932364 [Pholiota molesta]|nr:hypothetical protein BJ912DRAFT_932364 [Pholiota molesta]